MANGQQKVSQKKPEVCGPGSVKNGGKTYDASNGPKGMRETYKETGNPGNGRK
ncbi:hypothetical protein D3C71_1197580 [compost metagenome]